MKKQNPLYKFLSHRRALCMATGGNWYGDHCALDSRAKTPDLFISTLYVLMIILFTIGITRLLVPIVDKNTAIDMGGGGGAAGVFEMHHFYYGVALLVITFSFLYHTKQTPYNRFVALTLFGIAVAFIIDEFLYIAELATIGMSNYWSLGYLVGGFIIMFPMYIIGLFQAKKPVRKRIRKVI